MLTNSFHLCLLESRLLLFLALVSNCPVFERSLIVHVAFFFCRVPKTLLEMRLSGGGGEYIQNITYFSFGKSYP